MSAPALSRRELKNAKVYILPAGEVVDSVTVSKTTWPDANPTTNYTNYEFPEIEGMVQEVMSEDEVFLIPRDSGGYANDTEKHLRGIYYTGTTAKTNGYLKALQYAVPAMVAANTAQSPNTRAQLWFEALMLIELRSNAGVIIERIQTWCKVFLQDPGTGAGPQTSKVQFRCEVQFAALNTYIAP